MENLNANLESVHKNVFPISEAIRAENFLFENKNELRCTIFEFFRLRRNIFSLSLFSMKFILIFLSTSSSFNNKGIISLFSIIKVGNKKNKKASTGFSKCLYTAIISNKIPLILFENIFLFLEISEINLIFFEILEPKNLQRFFS